MPAIHNHGIQAPLLPHSTLPIPLTLANIPPLTLPASKPAEAADISDVYRVGKPHAAGHLNGQHDPSHASVTANHIPNSLPDVPTSVIVSTGTVASTMRSDLQPSQTKPSVRTILSAALLSTLTLLGLAEHFRPRDAEDASWFAASSSWLDRKACGWIGICGLLRSDKSNWRDRIHDNRPWEEVATNPAAFWASGPEDEALWSQEERKLREVPQYVLDYAPYVRLYSGENFWPCDIGEHLLHTTPHIDYTPVKDSWRRRTLDDLDELNEYGRRTYLQSDDNVEDYPDWLGGEANIPSGGQQATAPPADLRNAEGQSVTGKSDAPAVLIVVDKGNGTVDAFWFFFYSYNLGNTFFGVRFGNHVGDWEHTAIRFHKGKPIHVYFSEHSWGQAYAWEAVEKIAGRPVSYSASGTHAMYGSPGTHEYVLPFGLLYDVTDRGPLWDPRLNMHSYTYDYKNDTLRSSQLNPRSPINWFYFWGHWGDKTYPLSDPRQYKFAGQNHYVSGPLGPRFKRLGRKTICQILDDNEPCEIRTFVGPRTKISQSTSGPEELSEEEVKYWAARNKEHASHRW